MRKKNNRGEALAALLSRNIKSFRTHSGLSQAALAEKAGVSAPYMGAVERGEKWPGPATLAEIAHSLGLEPYDLLKPENRSFRDVKKVVTKLTKDISALMNESVKALNNIAKEGGGPEK
jgi:transcriptional regulator with XRE-family HTH domain